MQTNAGALMLLLQQRNKQGLCGKLHASASNGEECETTHSFYMEESVPDNETQKRSAKYCLVPFLTFLSKFEFVVFICTFCALKLPFYVVVHAGGVLDMEFPLSEQPAYGTWHIQATAFVRTFHFKRFGSDQFACL